ncbi:hypothetical protein C8R45DRAFT_1130828 [Mycena sanguinolenta]|nr:hypothetical protein C8R45DRAFT_1130828 [Mycena sanguinolenta]
MSTTIPRLDAITGALLIGTWASSLLYMAEVLQAVHYFRTFKKDNWKMKSYVAVTFAIDTISAVSDYACVYLYTITHAGDLVYLSKQNWAVPLYVISSSTVALLVQGFLAFMYWRLRRVHPSDESNARASSTHNTIIVCLLSILIVAAFGGGLASGLTIVLFPALKDRSKVRISGTVWMITQASADLIIAGALLLEVMKAKTVFQGQRRVSNMLNRLVSHIIQTGTVTAVIAVLAIMIFLINEETNIPVGILYTSGRVYVLSMLMNLNMRPSGRSQNCTTSNGQRGTLRFAQGTTHNFTTVQFSPNEADSTMSSILLSQATASIPEFQHPEIEMVPTKAKRVPEFHPSESHSRKSGRPKSMVLAMPPAVQATAGPPEIQSSEIEMVPIGAKQVPEA